jgi:hypothetical protein
MSVEMCRERSRQLADENDAPAPDPTTPAAELERLKRENEDLRGRLGWRRSGWRSFFAGLFAFLMCVAMVGAVLATWAHWTALNTERFVNTIAPVIKEQAVSEAISDEAVSRLFDKYKLRSRIERELKKVLPEVLKSVAGNAAGGAESLAKTLTQQIVKSSAFQAVWRRALTFSHEEAVKGIRATGPVQLNEKGEVVLDISGVLKDLQGRLSDLGLTFLNGIKLPDSLGRVVLYKNSQLGNVKQAVNVLDVLFWVLPWLAVLLLVIASFIANDRRKNLFGTSILLMAMLVVLMIVIKVVQGHYLGMITSDVNRHAAIVASSVVMSTLYRVDIALIIVGAITVLFAVIAGPYDWAFSMHKTIGLRSHMGMDKEEGSSFQKFCAFVAHYAWPLRIIGISAAALLILYLPQASVGAIIAVIVVYGLYLIGVELFR